jgi:RIO kinase 2
MFEVQDVPNDDLSDQEDAATRLEQLRLHRALGNDGNPEDEPPAPVSLYSEEEEESDSGDSDDSVGPAPSDYTQYVRAPRAPRQRVNVSKVSKLGKVDELRETVAGDLARAARSQGPRTKGSNKVGRAKGHKWKSNAAYQASKDTGGW